MELSDHGSNVFTARFVIDDDLRTPDLWTFEDVARG